MPTGSNSLPNTKNTASIEATDVYRNPGCCFVNLFSAETRLNLAELIPSSHNL
jgi:hypothetical protein